jgi:hypothetical protein
VALKNLDVLCINVLCELIGILWGGAEQLCPCSDKTVFFFCSALTEKIVSVLPEMKCPHHIEPHQIQGLDFIHIFPVIQVSIRVSELVNVPL